MQGAARSTAPSRRVEVLEMDCVVVGGGPAGLSAALNLARMRRSVAVIDDRDGRSLWGQTNRNYLGFPDGIPAAQIREAGRQQAARYGVRFLQGEVTAARREGNEFLLTMENCSDRARGAGRPENVCRDDEVVRSFGELDITDLVAEGPTQIAARCVVLATGVRDQLPHFPGWAECVGRSLFWCINCDGYETIDRRVAVVGHDEDAAETVLELLEFTPHLFAVAGRAEGFDLSASRLADLSENGIAAYACAVADYPHRDGQIECLLLDDPDRTRLDVDMVFCYRPPIARTEVARMLGVALNSIGQIEVDGAQQTNVPGVYAAGDVTSPHNHQISAAVHEGNEAAAAANYYLYRPVQKGPRLAGV